MGCESTLRGGGCPKELARENACPGHGRSARSVIKSLLPVVTGEILADFSQQPLNPGFSTSSSC